MGWTWSHLVTLKCVYVSTYSVHHLPFESQWIMVDLHACIACMVDNIWACFTYTFSYVCTSCAVLGTFLSFILFVHVPCNMQVLMVFYGWQHTSLLYTFSCIYIILIYMRGKFVVIYACWRSTTVGTYFFMVDSIFAH